MTEEEWNKKTCGECAKRRIKTYMSKGNEYTCHTCNEWDSEKFMQIVSDNEKACDYFKQDLTEKQKNVLLCLVLFSPFIAGILTLIVMKLLEHVN